MKKNNWSIELGRFVRQSRHDLGLTQAELADFSGCGVAYIHLIESGKSTLRLDKLLDVLTVLGLQLKLETGKKMFVIGE